MAKRRYKQYCMLAKALDVLGERWTLLILRDLLMGPKRFKDLLAGLPGIGTNLLSARLKELEEQGVVERYKLPAPASVSVWALTDTLGESLQEPILALAAWGRQFLKTPQKDEIRRPTWFFLALRRFYNAAAIEALKAIVVFELPDDTLYIRCDDGLLTTGEGMPASVDAIVTTTAQTVRQLVFGGLDASQAQSAGLIEVTGDISMLTRVLGAFG